MKVDLKGSMSIWTVISKFAILILCIVGAGLCCIPASTITSANSMQEKSLILSFLMRLGKVWKRLPQGTTETPVMKRTFFVRLSSTQMVTNESQEVPVLCKISSASIFARMAVDAVLPRMLCLPLTLHYLQFQAAHGHQNFLLICNEGLQSRS